ncbi:MAG: sulfurtransferase complex subunit TusB [Promethearchaeati archaeon SRVP18_Atabeyarchaeia-1]
MIVYLLGKSPFEFRSIETYLDMGERQSEAGVDVRIVLLHGAVLAARKNNRFEDRLRRLADAGVRIYLRKEDLEARAINNESLSSIGSPVDTVEIMKLAAESNTLVSVI